jgi:hypothetical protein
MFFFSSEKASQIFFFCDPRILGFGLIIIISSGASKSFRFRDATMLMLLHRPSVDEVTSETPPSLVQAPRSIRMPSTDTATLVRWQSQPLAETDQRCHHVVVWEQEAVY